MTSIYLLLVLFVSVATEATVFQRKKEYNYWYEGWQTMGVRQSFSIQAIRANLSLKVISDDIISFQMSHVQWAWNDDYHHVDYHPDRKQVKFEDIEGLNKTLMEYPVYIHYAPVEGKIRKLVIRREERENVNSMNLKLAVVQLLQLSQGCLADVNEQSPDSLWWSINEDGIGGDCQTSYHVSQNPQSKVRFCRKMRDFKWCSSRSEYRHLMPIVSNSSGSYDPYQTGSNQTSSTVYQLKRQQDGWVIDRVQALSSKHTYLHKSIKDPCKVWVNATLKLQSVAPIRSAHRNIPLDKSEVLTSLRYNFTIRKPDLQQPAVPNTFMPVALDFLLRQIAGYEQTKKDILETVWEIEQQLDPVTEISGRDIVNNTLHVQKLCSTLTKNQLQEVFQQIHTQKQKEIFCDAVISVGSNQALSAFFEWVKNDRIDQYTAIRLIRKIPFTLKTPTAAIVQQWLELSESNVVERNHDMKRACLLAMSNAFRLMCSTEYDLQPYPAAVYGPPCTSEMVSLLRRHMKWLENLIQSSPMPAKLSWINALASTGHKEACPTLKSIIWRDTDRHAVVLALNYLHRLPIEPCSLKNVTEHIYHDITRHPSERISALIGLVRMIPSRSQMHQVALSVLREPSQKVAEKTKRIFWSLANVSSVWSPDPVMKKLSSHAQELLPLLALPPNDQLGDYYSMIQEIFPDVISQQIELAPSHPDSLSLIINNFVKQVKSEKLDWFYLQRNFVEMWRPLKYVSEQMSHVQRSSPRDLSNLRQMGSLNVNQENPREPPFVYFAYKLWNSMDYDRVLEKLPEPSMSPLCAPGEKQKHSVYGTIPTIEEAVMVPSELGLPIVTARRGAWVYALAANCSSTNAQNETKLHARTEYDQYYECVTYDPFRVSVVKVSHVNRLHLQIPLTTVRTRKDPQNGRIDVQMDLSQAPPSTKLVKMHSKYYISTQKDMYKYSSRRPVPSKRIYSDESELPNPLGLSLKMKYSSVYRSIPKKQWKWFEPPTCDHDIEIVLDSQRSPTKKVELSMKMKYNPFVADNPGQKAAFSLPEHWQNIKENEVDAKHEAEQSLKHLQHPYSRNISWLYALTLEGSGQSSHAMYHGSVQAVYSPVKDKSAVRIVGKGKQEWMCLYGEYEAKPMSDDFQILKSTLYEIPFQCHMSSGERNCKSNIINIRGSVKSDPQKRIPPAWYQAHIKKCKEAQTKGFPSAPVCQAVKDVSAAFNQIEVEVEWPQQLSVSLRNASQKANEMWKHTFYEFMSNDPYSQNPSNKIQLQLEADNYWNTWDAKLVKPHETTRLARVPDIPLLSRVQLWSARRSPWQKLADLVYGADWMMCSVDHQVSRTFDQQVYNLSLPQQCRTLLLATASPQHLRVYTRSAPRGKVVTFETDAHVLAVEDQSDRWVVTWDKQPALQGDQYRCFPVPGNMCVRQANKEVHVEASNNCWNVIISRESTVIKANPLCIHRPWGWCGNMDGEWLAEEQDEERCVHLSLISLQKALQAPPVGGAQGECAPVRANPCLSERNYRQRYADYKLVDYKQTWQQYWPWNSL